MNKKLINGIIENIIKTEYPEFLDIKPNIEKVSISVKSIGKLLNEKYDNIDKRIYAFTFIKKDGKFKKVLRITIDNKGNIIKISQNR